MNVIDVRTKWFRNFRRFEVLRVNLSAKIGSSHREFREIEGSRNRAEIIELE